MPSKKFFGGNKQNFLKLLTRFVRSDVNTRVSEKRPRTFLAALQSIVAAGKSKNHHLRDFWRRSIFDFFDSIDPTRTRFRPPYPIQHAPLSMSG